MGLGEVPRPRVEKPRIADRRPSRRALQQRPERQTNEGLLQSKPDGRADCRVGDGKVARLQHAEGDDWILVAEFPEDGSAKAEDGRLTNHPTTIEVSSFLENLTDGLKFAAEKKKLAVEFVLGAPNNVIDASGGNVRRIACGITILTKL